MTEIPATKILDRDLSLQITREIRDEAGPALREAVDESVRVFERCSASAQGTDEHIGILFPFLHLAEIIDAVELCLQGGSSAGAGILLRAAFESLLTVEWITKEGVEKYGAAYVVADIHRRIAGLEQYSQDGARRAQLEAAMKADSLGGDIEIPVMSNAEDKIAGLRQVLEAPHLLDAAAEYEKARGARASIKFFALWGGPRSVEQLARKLGRAGQYEILYRGWSRMVHGVDVMRQLRGVDGAAAVQPFRSGEGFKDAYTFALAFCLDAMRAVLTVYRPDELSSSYPQWYKRHISPVMKRLAP
jgi:hypothetical protein